MKNKHRSDFLKHCKQNYPFLKDELNKQSGLLEAEVLVLINYAQSLVDQHNESELKALFHLLDFYYKNGNKALKSTIRNTICEDLSFSSNEKIERSWAVSLIPKALKLEIDEWREFMAWQAL